MKTLIVEDERSSRLFFEKLVRFYGHEVTACTNAEAALEAYQQTFYPLIILDLGLPGMDGFEFCRRIRSLPQEERSIILVITVYDRPEDLQTALDAGADDYLIKPVSSEQLQVRLTIIERQFHNLSERKRAEEALREREQWFAATLKSIGDAVITTDNEGVVTFMNPVAEALTGWRHNEAMGKDIIFKTTGEETPPHPGIFLQEPPRNEIVINIGENALLIARDGAEIPVEYSGAPIKDDKGNISGVVVVLHDITERKRAEEALRESEERFRTIFENAVIGLYRTTSDGCILMANSALLRMLGYSSFEELAQRNLEESGYYQRGQRSAFKQRIESEGKIIGLESIWSKRNGEPLFVRENATVVRDEAGTPLYYEGTVEDITERKQAEESLRRLNEELEQRVEARTAELKVANRALQESLETLRRAQDRLVQAEKMSALGNLVAGVAHEINTPVGIGVTAASYLEQTSREIAQRHQEGVMTPSDMENYLKIATKSSGMILGNLRRAANLIHSFKQVAVDQTTNEKRKFNLKEYIDEILLSLHPKLKKTRHSVTVLCPEDLELHSYPGAFSQITANFVINSLIHGFEHKAQGEILLEVTRENDTLQLRYSDNGKGISEEERSRIFEPFYTSKRGQGGTGLGLHIVYNLVTQRLNGHIECKSTPGEGTIFTIQMPIEEGSHFTDYL